MTELDLAAAQEQSTPHGGERGSLARFGIALSAVGISVAALVASGSANAGSEKPTTSGDPTCFPIPGGASGDTAVLNLTQTDATSSGWGAIRPSDEINMTQRSDPSSHVNFDGSDSANPNTALSEIGLDGRVCLDSFVGENGRVNNIVDLVAVIDGDSMRDIKPQRLLDNREDFMVSDDAIVVDPPTDTEGTTTVERSYVDEIFGTGDRNYSLTYENSVECFENAAGYIIAITNWDIDFQQEDGSYPEEIGATSLSIDNYWDANEFYDNRVVMTGNFARGETKPFLVHDKTGAVQPVQNSLTVRLEAYSAYDPDFQFVDETYDVPLNCRP